MVACKECSSPQVTGLRWYHWLELRSRWRRQQYSHFDTACQRPKGKFHFLFAVMIPPSAARYFRHLPAMSIKTTLHATAPLLYPCRRYPKCPWGLYASPPPVAMAVVGWFLCFPAFFFFWKNGFFFSHARLTPKKKSLRDLHQKKKISVEKKNATYAKKKKLRDLRQKKIKKRLTLISTIELRFPPWHCHVSAPHWVHVMDWQSYQKKCAKSDPCFHSCGYNHRGRRYCMRRRKCPFEDEGVVEWCFR